MTTVVNILDFIETLAPRYMKESWDHVGLNCGHLAQEVHTVLVALDPFEQVCHEAKEIGAELIVTHHALLWEPGFITDASEQGKNALFLIENNIACINAHTNLDYAPGGVNDILAEKLGLTDVSVISSSGTEQSGASRGLLRSGYVKAQSLIDFLGFIKSSLSCPGIRFVDGGKPVHFVAVGGGACAGELQKAAAAGCDTFVTSDIKYNQFWDAKALGVNLIDAGHFYTENPVCSILAEKISEAFPLISVKISKKHHDCMKFY